MTAVSATRTDDALLRLAIRIDAVAVAALGVALVVAAGPLSTITGLPTGLEYAIGVLSIAYGPLGFWLASQRRVRTTGLVIAVINLGTTVGLVVLAAVGLPATATGSALALAVAAYTLVIGLVQYVGVRRIA